MTGLRINTTRAVVIFPGRTECVDQYFERADVHLVAANAREACAPLVRGQRLTVRIEGEVVEARVNGRTVGDEEMGLCQPAVIGERRLEHGIDVNCARAGVADLVAVHSIRNAARRSLVADE